jgi:hypothetical protein
MASYMSDFQTTECPRCHSKDNDIIETTTFWKDVKKASKEVAERTRYRGLPR